MIIHACRDILGRRRIVDRARDIKPTANMDDDSGRSELPRVQTEVLLLILRVILHHLSLKITDHSEMECIITIAFNIAEGSLQCQGVAAYLLGIVISLLLHGRIFGLNLKEVIKRAEGALDG
jgi:hypothetical protein